MLLPESISPPKFFVLYQQHLLDACLSSTKSGESSCYWGWYAALYLGKVLDIHTQSHQVDNNNTALEWGSQNNVEQRTLDKMLQQFRINWQIKIRRFYLQQVRLRQKVLANKADDDGQLGFIGRFGRQ
jgi:hypothetical protein